MKPRLSKLPINRDFLRRQISDIREALANAKGLLEKPFEELGLYEKLALRYIIVELVEASAFACIHILRELYGVFVEGYAECFRKMSDLGLLPRSLAESLVSVARLRNLVVHRYWVIDDRKLYHLAKDGLKVFEEYAEILERLLEE